MLLAVLVYVPLRERGGEQTLGSDGDFLLSVRRITPLFCTQTNYRKIQQ